MKILTKNLLLKWQVYLFAVYFAIYELFRSNRISQVSLTTSVFLLAGALVFVFLLKALLSILFKSEIKATLLTSILFAIIFFFPTWVDILLDIPLFSKIIVSFDLHKKILIFCFLILIFLLISVWINKINKNLEPIAGYLSLLILSFIAFEFVGALNYQPNDIRLTDKFEPGNITQVAKPDIYYIILDHYSGNESLKKYGFDNSYFTNFLESKGFYVAHNSRSNYNYTSSSLSSSLNGSYINIKNKGRYSETDAGKLIEFINESKVVSNLENYGYRPNVYTIYPIKDEPGKLMARPGDKAGASKSFLATLFRAFYQKFDIFSQKKLQKVFYLYNINSLKFLDSLAASKDTSLISNFNFAHTLTAHTPFVVDSTGAFEDDINATHSKESYVREVKYVNKRIMSFIEKVLAKPGLKPIIILQSDHGSHLNDLQETTTILNAYYFPDKNYSGLYPEISPVNTFRVIFNKYFGTKLPVLKDRSYYVFYP